MRSGHVRAPHSRFRANLEQPSAPNKRLAIVYRFSITVGPDDAIFCAFLIIKINVDLMEFQAKNSDSAKVTAGYSGL